MSHRAKIFFQNTIIVYWELTNKTNLHSFVFNALKTWEYSYFCFWDLEFEALKSYTSLKSSSDAKCTKDKEINDALLGVTIGALVFSLIFFNTLLIPEE